MKISKRGQQRYEAICKAALELFLQNGYERTSLQDIVSKSGGSLSSVYKFFKNKDGLFATILQQKFDEFKEKLINALQAEYTEDVKEFFNKFGLVYLEIFFNKENISLFRIIISESHKNEEMGRAFSELLVDNTLKIVTCFINKPHIKKQFKSTDTNRLAFNFCALVREYFFTRTVIMGLEPEPMSTDEKRKFIAEIVDTFLHGALR